MQFVEQKNIFAKIAKKVREARVLSLTIIRVRPNGHFVHTVLYTRNAESNFCRRASQPVTMASRDLTAAFLERRSACHMRRRDGKKLTVGRTDDLLLVEEGGIQMTSLTSSMDALPPQWVDDVDSVNAALEDIVRMMGILQSMHASRVGSVFGKDLDDMEGKIEKLTRDITDRFRQAERVLQRVGAATRRAGGEEATVGANVQRRCVY